MEFSKTSVCLILFVFCSMASLALASREREPIEMSSLHIGVKPVSMAWIVPHEGEDYRLRFVSNREVDNTDLDSVGDYLVWGCMKVPRYDLDFDDGMFYPGFMYYEHCNGTKYPDGCQDDGVIFDVGVATGIAYDDSDEYVYFEETFDANPAAEWEKYLTFAGMTQVSEVPFTALEYEQSTLPKIGESGNWLCNNYETFDYNPSNLVYDANSDYLSDDDNHQVTVNILLEGDHSAIATTLFAFAGALAVSIY